MINGRKIVVFLVLIALNTIVLGQVDTLKIKEHLRGLTKTEKARNYKNLEALNAAASYIFDNFQTYADSTYYQPFYLGEKKSVAHEYKNVIAVFGSENKETIVIGAHYDVCGEQEGADDNASGVVGLLELARLLKGQKLSYRIEMVAYTLEEPPFFRSEKMGSYVHANSLIEKKVDVYGMVCLEMIGYFADAKKSQDYPIGALSLIYGNRGNYITLVNKFKKGEFPRKFSKAFKGRKNIRTKKFTGPVNLPGIDFSDHLNYWRLGINAVMITDTAFYRNKNYHKNTDKMETLDIQRMKLVIQTVFESLLKINK